MNLVASAPDSALMRPGSTMLVLTKVGQSTVTVIPVPDSSAARVSDSDSTPALLSSWAAMPGVAPNAVAEATLMMPRGARDAPASRSTGANT